MPGAQGLHLAPAQRGPGHRPRLKRETWGAGARGAHTRHSNSCAPASVLSYRAGGEGSRQHSATGWGMGSPGGREGRRGQSPGDGHLQVSPRA